jgi:hypothetical protein
MTHNLLDDRPRSVCLLGLGPSNRDWIGELGRKKNLLHVDQIWGINTAYRSFNVDVVWAMDDFKNIMHDYPEWAAELKGLRQPIMTCRKHKDFKNLVEYPIDAVVDNLKDDYFSTTVAYAIAYAIHIQVETLYCFGLDFFYPSASVVESGIGGAAYWLGVARERGVHYKIPNTSTLLDANLVQDVKIEGKLQAKRFLYGYDYNPQHAKKKVMRGVASAQEKIAANSAYRAEDPTNKEQVDKIREAFGDDKVIDMKEIMESK